MRKISDVHGTFTSFKDLGAAMKIKDKVRIETCKCKKCGQPLRNVPGTNVWMCDFVNLEDAKLPDETEVQVFTKCGNVVLTA